MAKRTTTRTKELKNKPAYGGELLKMDNQVYALRRKVIDFLYRLKDGYDLPRVEVRIVSQDTMACAYAYLGGNIVHMNEKYMSHELFNSIILHELVHAVFGVSEVIGCPLMHCSQFWVNRPNEQLAFELFKKYYTEWKNK